MSNPPYKIPGVMKQMLNIRARIMAWRLSRIVIARAEMILIAEIYHTTKHNSLLLQELIDSIRHDSVHLETVRNVARCDPAVSYESISW